MRRRTTFKRAALYRERRWVASTRLTREGTATHTHTEFFGKFPDNPLESNGRSLASNLCQHGSLSSSWET